MKSTLEWHALQDGFARLLEQTRFSVWPVLTQITGESLPSDLSVRQKFTASQATALHTPNVAPDRCGKHNTLRVPA